MKKLKNITPIIFSLAVVFLFWIKRIVFLKYYPPIMNFTVFLIFFTSLFGKETIIQKFARMIDGELDEKALTYTRNVTYVWCAFTLLNTLISIWTIFLSDEIWIFYNGFLSYILTGFLFGIEYIIRIIFKKKHGLK